MRQPYPMRNLPEPENNKGGCAYCLEEIRDAEQAVIEAAKKWKKGRDAQILIDALDILQKSKEIK